MRIVKFSAACSLDGYVTGAGLVDEITLAVQPILLGGGTALLSTLTQRKQLKLVSSVAFESGVLHLKYDIMPQPGVA